VSAPVGIGRVQQLQAKVLAGVKMNREERRELARLTGARGYFKGPHTAHKQEIRALMKHRDWACTPDQIRRFRNARKASA
jgi:hypothetical protein